MPALPPRSVLRLIMALILAFGQALSTTFPARAQAIGQPAYPVEIVTQTGHSAERGVDVVLSSTFSPDGKTVLSGKSEDLKLWDVATGKEIRSFAGHSGEIWSVAFSPDGRTVLSGSTDNTLKLWDVATGKEIRSFAGHTDEVYSVAFSPDGRAVLSGSKDNTLKLWDAATGKAIRSFTGVSCPTFSPDGRTVLSLSDEKAIKLWDLATGKEIRTFAGVSCPAFSPDGRTVLSESENGILNLWDVATGRKIQSLADGPGTSHEYIFSPDGKMILSGNKSNQTLKIFDVLTGKEIRNFDFEMRTATVYHSAFSPDGRTVLVGSFDKTLKILDVATGGIVRTFTGYSTEILSVAFSPDGKTALSGSRDNALKLWEVATGKEIRSFAGHSGEIWSVAFSPDGRTVLSGSTDNTLKLWDVATGKELRSFTGHSGLVHSVAFSPDGRRALSGSWDHTLKLWDVATGKEINSFEGHSEYVKCVAVSPDGKAALSGSWDKTIKLWDLATGKEIRTLAGHSDTVHSVAFSLDGKTVLSGSSDGTQKLWDVSTGKEIRTFTLVSGGEDKTVKLWDVVTGVELRTFLKDVQGVTAIAFSPDGKQALLGGAPKPLRLLDIASGSLITTIYPLSGDGYLTLTPEGFFDASSREAAEKALAVVRGLEVYSLDQVYDQLYRPDLVREKLVGDPKGLVKAAAKINLDLAISSGAPPKVSFVSPPKTVAADRAALQVDLADEGGGLGKVEWRVNGVTVGLGNRGLGRVDATTNPSANSSVVGAPKTLRLAQEIALVPGENTIEVVAYNAAGLVASRPASVKITSTAAVAKGLGKLFVVAVGVNDYFDSRLALNYAVPDARAVVDGLKSAIGDVYAAVETRLVTDAEVTSEKLEAVLTEIGSKAKPQDTFVLFVAGHGKTVDGRYYYLPRDFRYRDETSFASSGIGQTQFQDWLSRVKAQRSVLLFDTCESGSLTEDRAALRGVERAVAMEKMTAAMGRTTIAAASDDKPALEGYKGHGVFTYAILSGLSAADQNGDGKVDVLELIQYLDREVPTLSDKAFKVRQIPQAKFSGNNFALAAKTAIVPDAPQAAPSSVAPSKPTHVVITPAEVLAAAGSGATVGRLVAGSQVSVVKTEAGWVLIARDGKPYGYVKEASVVRLQ